MKKLILAFPVLALLFTACSGIKTSSDYDKAVDFSNYQTFEYYGWDKGSDQLIGAFDKERIEKAFAEEFDRRNLKQVEKLKGGDLIVTLFIVTQNKSQKRLPPLILAWDAPMAITIITVMVRVGAGDPAWDIRRFTPWTTR